MTTVTVANAAMKRIGFDIDTIAPAVGQALRAEAPAIDTDLTTGAGSTAVRAVLGSAQFCAPAVTAHLIIAAAHCPTAALRRAATAATIALACRAHTSAVDTAFAAFTAVTARGAIVGGAQLRTYPSAIDKALLTNTHPFRADLMVATGMITGAATSVSVKVHTIIKFTYDSPENIGLAPDGTAAPPGDATAPAITAVCLVIQGRAVIPF
jgi:hypothetical protein